MRSLCCVDRILNLLDSPPWSQDRRRTGTASDLLCYRVTFRGQIFKDIDHVVI